MKFANVSHIEQKPHFCIVMDKTDVEFIKTRKRGDQVLSLAPWLYLTGPFDLPFSPFFPACSFPPKHLYPSQMKKTVPNYFPLLISVLPHPYPNLMLPMVLPRSSQP